MQFVTDEELQNLAQNTISELNAKEYGITRVDEEGIILFYNQYEVKLSGVSEAYALNKNYFKTIAPCTNTSLFFGVFRVGIEKKELNKVFMYVFTYKMRPTPVIIHLYRDKQSQTNWILVKKK